jgi:hypothetical protein
MPDFWQRIFGLIGVRMESSVDFFIENGKKKPVSYVNSLKKRRMRPVFPTYLKNARVFFFVKSDMFRSILRRFREFLKKFMVLVPHSISILS